MKGKKAVFCGDIGCYTLGNAMPLDMVDTCLCMGAGITMAQGLSHMNPDTVCFAFVGDSTFFASGMTGVVNAVYNEADIILCVLDNSTTAMTGHQPHPGTGRNMMGNVVEKVSIEKVLEGIGVKKVLAVDPLNLEESVRAVRECAGEKGARAIVFRSPCVALTKPEGKCAIDAGKCVNCKKCIREIGCPALIVSDGQVTVDRNLCTGCGLCGCICPVKAIGKEGET
jgi:indolepyruvate ferredoxin oxidoreductase alpha subunit